MPDVWTPVNEGRDVAEGELGKVAAELLSAGSGISVWLFYGEMGSGKTTLIKAVCTASGVKEGMSSPTFSIVNEYNGSDGNKIFHFDLYRLKNEKEVSDIGTSEYLDSSELCLVEWPEKLGSLTPENHFKVRLTATGPASRKIEYQHV